MRSLCLLAFLAAAAPAARAAERPLEAVIDERVAARLRDDGVPPAGQADDATIVRRLTLDLAGRIPTVGETDAYVKAADADKRGQAGRSADGLVRVRPPPGRCSSTRCSPTGPGKLAKGARACRSAAASATT